MIIALLVRSRVSKREPDQERIQIMPELSDGHKINQGEGVKGVWQMKYQFNLERKSLSLCDRVADDRESVKLPVQYY